MRRVFLGGFRSRWALAALGLVLAGASAVSVAAGAQRPTSSDVLGVRLGGDANETRIVVDLARPASGHIEDAGDAPDRMVLDLRGVSASGVLQGKGQGLVRAWSVDTTSGDARLELDLAGGADVQRRFLIPPADGSPNYRYVLDIVARMAHPKLERAALNGRPLAA